MSDIDENQLLKECGELEEEILQIKQLKLTNNIQQHEIQYREEIEVIYQERSRNVQETYLCDKEKLTTQYQDHTSKVRKNIQQSRKQLDAYEAILEDLLERKSKVEIEYQEKVDEANRMKEKCCQEWKKLSNEQLKKFAIKHLLTAEQMQKNKRRTI